MKFKIPFTVSNIDKLKERSAFLHFLVIRKKSSKMQEYLNGTETHLSREEYLTIVYRSTINIFFLTLIISFLILFLIKASNVFLTSLAISFIFAMSVFSMQSAYPMVYNSQKQRNIEKNLIPALNDIYVQLNSGIPLFSILVNVSSSDYGELSNEFRKVIKKINAGMPEIEVLEEMGEHNSSIFLRRAIWQISNGMRAGSDISIIIKESIKSLNEEQLIQIQKYGNRLNPMIMFYMLISVILPALSITFLTIISSIVNLPETTTRYIFIGLFIAVIVVQITFLGTVKSVRPSLL